MKFIDTNQDRWVDRAPHDAADDAAAGAPDRIAPAPYALLQLAQWLAVRERWPAEMPVGLVLPNDAVVSTVSADLPRFALISLTFPKWTDGRAYSQAHRLRTRHRYAGELRATGQVLVDMLPLLQRNGFDSVLLRPDQSLDAARRALTFLPGHYQGDAAGRAPRFAEASA